MRAIHEMSVKMREFAKTASPNSVEITTKFYLDHTACDRHDDFSVQGRNQPGPQLSLNLLETAKKAISRHCYKSVVVSPVLMSS